MATSAPRKKSDSAPETHALHAVGRYRRKSAVGHAFLGLRLPEVDARVDARVAELLLDTEELVVPPNKSN